MVALCCQEQHGSLFKAPPDGVAAVGFRELGRYRLWVEHDGPCRLFIDEAEPPPAEIGSINVWTWQPGFFAGEVLAELFDGAGASIARYRLDVSPDPAKLGRETFGHMVEELFAFDPRFLIGSEAAQVSIGIEGDVIEPHLEYARLKRYGPQLLAGLKAVCEKPHTRLSRDREWRPAHQVKRLDQRSLLSVIRSPSAIGCLNGIVQTDGEIAVLFDIATSQVTLDTPANRAILFIIHAVLRRTRAVADALRQIAENERPDSTRTDLAPRLGFRLRLLSMLEADLRRACKRVPFVDVTCAEITAAGLTVVSAHPLYSRAFRMGWHILRPGIAGEREEETLWMSPTWEIYERWCFLETYKVLQSEFPNLTWHRHFPSKREDCILFTGSVEGIELKLYFQPRFPAYDKPPWDGFRSISGERYPDIVVAYSSGEVRQLLVLDAKYRASRENVLDAMQSAHLYRDCLRWHGLAPMASLLLIPRGGGASWLEREDFRAKHRVGVLPVSPTTTSKSLGQALAAMLGTVGGAMCENSETDR